jgi:hypothetical protein
MCFPWEGKIRHHSGGPIAPQLGQLYKKVAAERRSAVFFSNIRADSTAAAVPASLATDGAMRETMPA